MHVFVSMYDTLNSVVVDSIYKKKASLKDFFLHLCSMMMMMITLPASIYNFM